MVLLTAIVVFLITSLSFAFGLYLGSRLPKEALDNVAKKVKKLKKKKEEEGGVVRGMTPKEERHNGSDSHYIRRKCRVCGFKEELKRHRGKLYNPISRSSWLKRRQDRDKHAKDIIQPFMKNKPNPDFIKAYKDDDELLDNYFTKEELKRYEG